MVLVIRKSHSIVLLQMKYILFISFSLSMAVVEIDAFHWWFFIWASVMYQGCLERASVSVNKQKRTTKYCTEQKNLFCEAIMSTHAHEAFLGSFSIGL